MSRTGTCSTCGKAVQRGPSSRDNIVCRECSSCKYLPKPCAECGEVFQPKPKAKDRPPQQYCTKSCATRAGNKQRHRTSGPRAPGDDRSLEARARHKARVRARRLRIAATWDGVTDEQILERDRWMCWICKRRISKALKWPHPRSASIDHLVPFALGGDDTAFNKKAAHLGCNMVRQTGAKDEHPMLNFSLDPNVEIKPKPRPKPAYKPRPCATCGELKTEPGPCTLHTSVRYANCRACKAARVSQPGTTPPRLCQACQDTGRSKPCSVPDCGRPVFATSLCAAHFHRNNRYGDVMAHIPVANDRAARISVAALLKVGKPDDDDGLCPQCMIYPLVSCCDPSPSRDSLSA